MIAGIHRFFKYTRSRGMALVITLSTLVLVTVLVLAFFSRAQFNRQVSFSGTNMLKADILGRSALDIIVGELRDEFTSGSSSNGGNATYPKIYFPDPANPAQSLPAPEGVSSATGSLVKVSGANIPIRPSGTIRGSSVSISTPSRNNRLISASRWFTSTMSSPQLGSQGTLPTWLFITRGNDVKTPASIDTAKDPSSNDYVIGRFAYTVYDIGGLLDVNVAGYPGVVSATDTGYKSSTAYTDLSVVGVSPASGFVAWRNAVTGTSAASFKEWATGIVNSSGTVNSAGLAAARSGHIEAVAGDNAVLSRHDLLKNASLSGTMAQLLTHFSRSVNAASAMPATVTASNPNLADVRFSSAGTITHYRDDGTTETYNVNAGDPLLQRRFSLAKLAWIGQDGPNASAFASSLSDADRKAAIQACFGLVLVSDGNNSRWSYQPAGTPGAIDSLGNMAGLSREPNFFELLKAGIVEGSIGKASALDSTGVTDTMANSDQPTREGIKDLQILKIGANAINCIKNDNYPVTLLYSNAGLTVPIYGTADLPYLSHVINEALFNATVVSGSNATLQNCSAVVMPALFNPHRSGTAAVSGPSKIQIRIASGTLDKIYITSSGMSGGLYLSPSSDLSTLSSIIVPSSSFEKFRSGIKLVYDTDATSSTTLVSQLGSSVITGTSGKYHGFNFYTYQNIPPTATYIYASNGILRTRISNLLIVMEYWDNATGQWHVYDTLVGNEKAAGVTGISKPSSVTSGNVDFPPNPYTANSTTSSHTIIDNQGQGIIKMDPRGSRFGVSSAGGYGPSSNQALTQCGIQANVPFLASSASNHNFTSGVLYPGKMIQGGTNGDQWSTGNGTNITNVADPDGTTRPADGWLDTSSSGTGTNLYASVSNTTSACRPVILHRPFQNVAELGYVFRDSPWKSVNFFDKTSGDGALLDLFSIADEPSVVAGKVSLNSTQSIVQQALLTGAAQNADGTGPLSTPSGIASSYNGNNGYALSSGSATSAMPINIAGLTAFMSSSNLNSAYPSSTTPIKSMRESVVRALAESTQTRTWNFLVDVVAQTGRYPSTANTVHSLNDFIVEGESRYWLSIAIDRYTGKIVSQQLEPVNE